MLLFGSGRRPRSAAVLCARVTPRVHPRTTPTAFITAGPRSFLTLQISLPTVFLKFSPREYRYISKTGKINNDLLPIILTVYNSMSMVC